MGRNYSATAVDTTLASAISSSATSISVAATTGFPTAPFLLAIIDSPGSQEIVNVVGVTGTTLTVTRAYDLTVATAHPANALVRHVMSAIDLREAQQHIDSASGVHGVGAGNVVGTSTAQALTNKDFTSGTNTFPTFITGFLVPTGASFEYPSTAAAPAGYLKEDGGEYLIATYTALYNILTVNGTVFPYGANTNGSGAAGSTHFRTRNRAGKTPVGYQSTDTDFNAIGKTGGAKTHTLSATEMPSHTHTLNAAGTHSHGGATTNDLNVHGHAYQNPTANGNVYVTSISGGQYENVARYSTTLGFTGPGDLHTHGINADGSHTHTANNTGGGGAHNNMQPYIVTNWIIKT